MNEDEAAPTLRRMLFRLGSIACVSGMLVACSGSSGPGPSDFDGGTSSSSDGTTPDGGKKEDGQSGVGFPGVPPDSPQAKRCRIACTAPEVSSCEKQNRDTCVERCVTKLADLSDECASCLLNGSRWSGTYCSGCATCSFTSGGKAATCYGNEGPEGEPPACCKPEDESCTFKMPGPAEGTCKTICLK